MDQRVVAALTEAGIDASLKTVYPGVGIEVDDGRPIPVGKTVKVFGGDKQVEVELEPISKLLTGTKQPPSFQSGPTPEYVPFFFMLEAAALDFCEATERLEYDEEIARIYNLLRRRPDGTDPNPLFAHLQATARLYLSLRDVSPAELEAVLNRLTRSVKRWAEGAASTNYLRVLEDHMSFG
ncbi:MAG: hypothetical protein ACOX6T_11640 [Myxococcales bacterium]|jgi:hypothetical protein